MTDPPTLDSLPFGYGLNVKHDGAVCELRLLGAGCGARSRAGRTPGHRSFLTSDVKICFFDG